MPTKLRCPRCGNIESFTVNVNSMVGVDSNGEIKDESELEMSPYDDCFCNECDFQACLSDFYNKDAEDNMLRISTVGNGKVYLIAGGGKIYTDIAARFCKSERPVKEIINSPYSPEIVHSILNSGHKAALEFDYFIFGVEGYSRVCETQLVRKRMASYLIKSGRAELKGNRVFSCVMPENIANFSANLVMPNGGNAQMSGTDLALLISSWYDQGLKAGIPEEDLRYLKPQATEFKGIIGMNAHALMDFFAVRCCQNAQAEIRDMANKMLNLCREAAPDLFKNAGPNCVQLGYCPENDRQNARCKGKVPTKLEALDLLREKYVKE